MTRFPAMMMVVAVGVTVDIPCRAQAPARPNVVLILTDDQGYGDLGVHGNPRIKTPNLDRLAREGVRFTHFRVSPVCSPTRSALMTGRYNYRTGVVDTYLGRSMMRGEEVTLAEMLGGAGYATGIFGKWHLGDNAPMRPIDQGFRESLVHGGGGITQPADPPGNHYQDPILKSNGREERTRGYCSDVFTDAAIGFIREHRKEPFFTYLAFNCPHDPLETRPEDLKLYEGVDLSNAAFPAEGQPIGKSNAEMIAKVYGMVTNIDANVGRLLAALRDLGIVRDTIVIFLTDNGPAHARYRAGLRGQKGSVFEGGIRAPCFVRWPAGFEGGRVTATPAASIDWVPTLLDACRIAPPKGVKLDGTSVLPVLEGHEEPAAFRDRTLCLQWHRGDAPERGRAFAAIRGPWKLVKPEGAVSPLLFNLDADPYETRNRAAELPERVEELRQAYDAWFTDVTSPPGPAVPRILLGSAAEPSSTLTRQDWRGPRAGWTPQSLGHYEVEFAATGRYGFRLDFPATTVETRARLSFRDLDRIVTVPVGAQSAQFEDVPVDAGPARLEAAIGDVGATYVHVTRSGR